MGRAFVAAAAALMLNAAGQASPAPPRPPPPLVLERIIPLKGVAGRIDHLAFDPAHRRLFVAELGNGSVEALDVASGRSLGRIMGLKEPQGLAYLPTRDELAVASGGDGSVRFYHAADLAPAGMLRLGEDADNVRVDPRSGDIVVGYGSGALAIIDPARQSLAAVISLPAHPEGFQIDGERAFVNLPDAGKIAAIDLAKGKVIATWPNQGRRWNFPMALDKASGDLAVVYRLPARLVMIEASSGRVKQALPTCGDADDVFFDTARQRVYVSCGDGVVEVFGPSGGGYAATASIPTRSGARTALFEPSVGRLFVAARAGSEGAAILVFKPVD